MPKTFHLHLVSDATGETINSVMRACLVQFEDSDHEVTEHSWSLVRTPGQMDRALAGIKQNPGLVLYTIVNDRLREQLVEGCRAAQIQSVSVLDPVITAMAAHFGQKSRGQSGRQHELDAEYFDRIEAMNFALAHDDGQSSRSYNEADVILIGVSRSSKTPTCIYLANRGIKCANVPIVPNCPMPPELFTVKKPLVVGLTKDATQLVQIRKNRLQMIARDEDTDYVDLSVVREEVAMARRLCSDHGWPVIDVTRRSIEETAATIIQLLQQHQDGTLNTEQVAKEMPSSHERNSQVQPSCQGLALASTSFDGSNCAAADKLADARTKSGHDGGVCGNAVLLLLGCD